MLCHEPIGIAPGDHVVVPFQIACGICYLCGQGLQAQGETTAGPARR